MYGQSNYFSFDTITKEDVFSFPILSDRSDSIISEKINQFLQLSELNILKGFENKDIFEVITLDDGSVYGGKTAISFGINNNDYKVLSLGFFKSSYGATSNYWSTYYNFNSGNGELIQLKDLFTKEGFKTFAISVYKRRVLHLSKELKKLKKAEREEFNEVFNNYKSDDLRDFYIKDNTIFIDGDNSFRKNLKFSGIETIDSINLSEFKDYLNDYGKCLFSINPDSIAKYHSNELPQLFRGTIADRQILMVLNGCPNEILGVYAYKKYGRGISLEGKLENGTLTMAELNSNFETVGFIEAKYDGRQIIGTWSNIEKTKTFKVILKRE
jgi:hypothetical protein